MNHWVIAALFFAWVAVLLVCLREEENDRRMDRVIEKTLGVHRVRRPKP